VKRILAVLVAAAALLFLDAAPVHASTVGGPRLLELLPGYDGGNAQAVNAAGVVVGNIRAADGRTVPVRWVDGQVTALELPSGYQGTAFDINSAGLIVGNIIRVNAPGANSQPVSWRPDGRLAWLAPSTTAATSSGWPAHRRPPTGLSSGSQTGR